MQRSLVSTAPSPPAPHLVRTRPLLTSTGSDGLGEDAGTKRLQQTRAGCAVRELHRGQRGQKPGPCCTRCTVNTSSMRTCSQCDDDRDVWWISHASVPLCLLGEVCGMWLVVTDRETQSTHCASQPLGHSARIASWYHTVTEISFEINENAMEVHWQWNLSS